MSPLASHGSAIGYFMPSASCSFLAAAFISSNVVGGVMPFLSKTALAVGHDVGLGLHGNAVHLALVAHRLDH